MRRLATTGNWQLVTGNWNPLPASIQRWASSGGRRAAGEWRAAVWLTAAACAVARDCRHGESRQIAFRRRPTAGRRPPHRRRPDLERQARATCGGCHLSAARHPDAGRVARRDRPDEIHPRQPNSTGGPPGMPPVQLPPDMQPALAFYTSRAPNACRRRTRGRPQRIANPIRRALAMTECPARQRYPTSAWSTSMATVGSMCSARTCVRGWCSAARPAAPTAALSVVASIPHPSHVTLADVDGDGARICSSAISASSFPPITTKARSSGCAARRSGKFGAFWLDGWPRVADVEGGDFNGDGKKDLAVAAFGWRKTGHVTIVENRTANATQPDFTTTRSIRGRAPSRSFRPI